MSVSLQDYNIIIKAYNDLVDVMNIVDSNICLQKLQLRRVPENESKEKNEEVNKSESSESNDTSSCISSTSDGHDSDASSVIDESDSDSSDRSLMILKKIQK